MGLAEIAAHAEEEKARKARLAELGGVEKTAPVAWLAWLVTGWFGGHRFYLRKHGWLMLAWWFAGILILPAIFGDDAGFGIFLFILMVWWITDAFFIRGWIDSFRWPYERAIRQMEDESLAEGMTLVLTREAQKYKGRLTVAQGVLATGLTFVEIERCLMEMVKTGYVQVDNTDDGSLLFDFGDLPEYDEGEAIRQASEEAHAIAVHEMSEALEQQAALAKKGERRAENRSAAKHGIAAGLAMFGARALFGEVFDDDDE